MISVGNLTTGGTGKTPVVLWLARYFSDRGIRPAILSRGYQGSADGPNDEAQELEWRIPDVPHLQDSDRSGIAKLAVEQQQAQCLLLDDGFQHRRLARDLDIVLIDATCPFGFGYLLPRGLLREPLAQLKFANLIVITRTEQVASEKICEIRATLAKFNNACPIIEARTVASCFTTSDRDLIPLAELKEKKVVATAGIGNPQNFLTTLKDLGIDVVATRWFPDHHAYSEADIQQLEDLRQASAAQHVVCTLKDLVKIRERSNQVIALLTDIEFDDESVLHDQLNLEFPG